MAEKTYCICEKCGKKHTTDLRVLQLYKGLSITLGQIYKWCKEKGIHEFQRSDVSHIMGSISYSRFADIRHFGGLTYNAGPKMIGINMERCEKFFTGESVIPTKIFKNTITGEMEKTEYKHVSEIPHLKKFLDDNGLYKPEYVPGTLFNNKPKSDDDIIDL